MAGAIAVAGVGAVLYTESRSQITKQNDEDAKLAARITTLETTPGYSLPSSVSSGIAANCAALKAIDALTGGAGSTAALITAVTTAIPDSLTC